MNSDSHVKTFTPITAIEAIAALAHAGDTIACGFAFRDNDTDPWQEQPLAGAKFEGLGYVGKSGCPWRFCARVTLAPKIADGHNPHSITIPQLEGEYRLMTREEILHRAASKVSLDESIEKWDHQRRSWMIPAQGNHIEFTYRTKQPSGFYLPPKPAPAPALKPWDFASAPKGCVLLRPITPPNFTIWWTASVTEWTIDHIYAGSNRKWTYADAFKSLEHSTDFVNWSPCGSA